MAGDHFQPGQTCRDTGEDREGIGKMKRGGREVDKGKGKGGEMGVEKRTRGMRRKRGDIEDIEGETGGERYRESRQTE